MGWLTDLLPTLVSAGTTLYASNQAKSANKKAAQQENLSTQAAAALSKQYLDNAQQQFGAMRTQAQPGVDRLTQLATTDPNSLTPDQIRALSDARESSLAGLAVSGLRGSGKATSAVINDTQKRMREGYVSNNQTRADTAASNLSGQYFNAGNNEANVNRDLATSGSNALMKQGETTSSATTANGALSGQAIGDIGAIIADQIKNQTRYGKKNRSGEV